MGDDWGAQPSSGQQQPLPTVLKLVSGRREKSKRTPEQDASNRDFLAGAGRVEFGRHEATLQGIWMALAYFASLSDHRICYATVEHLGERARRSGRTVRRHLPALMARGLVQCSDRKGGHTPSTWFIVLPQSVRAGRTRCPSRAETMSAEVREVRKKEKKSTSSSGARNFCENCTNDWPASYGPKCHTCGYNPSTRLRVDEPKARPIEIKAPRPDHPTLTPERCAELEAEAINNGYRKRDGRWAKFQADEKDTGPVPRTPPQVDRGVSVQGNNAPTRQEADDGRT